MLIRLTAFFALCSTPALAGEVTLWLGGEAFDGGPAFSAFLDGQLIGSGTVDVDKAADGGEPFTFSVPDDVLQSAQRFVVQLTNDKYTPGVGDRNLQVIKVQIGDQTLSGTDFAFIKGDGTAQEPGITVLQADAQMAVLSRSDGHWVAGPAVAEAPAQEPAPSPAVAATEAPAAAAPVAESSTTEATAQPEAAQAATDCIESVSVVGFKNREVELTPDQANALQPIIDRAKAGDCGVVVTGFSSTAGRERANREISEARAKVVLDHLVKAGATFTAQQVTGAGETRKFGPAQEDNRRVVVQLVK